MPDETPFDTPEAIVAALGSDGHVYQRDAVDAAIANREAITPHLIGIIEEQVRRQTDLDEYPGQIGLYALMLLGFFRATEAHEAIMALAGLPGGVPENLLGDTVSEDLSYIMLATCGGSLDRLRALLLNEHAYSPCRSAAARALAYGVAEGSVPRQTALEAMVQVVGTIPPGDPGEVGGMVMRTLANLAPGEAVAAIEAAYREERVDPYVMDLESVKECIEEGLEEGLDALRGEMAVYASEDFHDRMSWWACFRRREKQAQSRPGAMEAMMELLGAGQLDRAAHGGKSSKQKKQQRKAAKKSRRRNRRKK